VPEVESEDDVVRALEAASRFVDLDRLAISTQSGLPELVGIFGGFRGSATTFTLVVALRSICRCQNM